MDSGTGKSVNKTLLLKLAVRIYQGFNPAYKVYKHLRDKGLVVTPGIRFGADFAVYERGLGLITLHFSYQ